MNKNPSSASPLRVAVVEDDRDVCRSLVEILEGQPDLKCVGSFASAEEAIEKLPSLRPRVVVMDVNLPGMSGVECVKRLVPLMPCVQVVMLTVHEDSDIIFESLAAGACGYLLKPPAAGELVEAVRDVFAGGAPMTMSIARKVVQSFNRRDARSSVVDKLSPREREVLAFLEKGLTYKEVAAEMGVTYATVHRHLESIYRKLHVQSRSHAVAKYLGGG